MNSWEYRNVDDKAPKWPSYFLLGLLCFCVVMFALILKNTVIKPTNSDSAAKAAMEAWRTNK